MENMTLEKELQARILLHKIAIAGGTVMQAYIQKRQGEVNIPDFQLEEMADEYSNKVLKAAMCNGTFDELYDKAWEAIKYDLDEYTKVS